ncbi:MAG: hypothetical protein FWG18_01570 [Alphaproteobacteria bacterium]|nr:hypothetical protein [Alphaproteobacteria bacterium]
MKRVYGFLKLAACALLIFAASDVHAAYDCQKCYTSCNSGFVISNGTTWPDNIDPLSASGVAASGCNQCAKCAAGFTAVDGQCVKCYTSCDTSNNYVLSNTNLTWPANINPATKTGEPLPGCRQCAQCSFNFHAENGQCVITCQLPMEMIDGICGFHPGTNPLTLHDNAGTLVIPVIMRPE